MPKKVSKQVFGGVGSVALADILANSVAVIIILIIVTLSVQQDEAQKKIEQNADITTILARQLATTVVYNDLPSSPPALLHNYNSCAIPHDCNLSLYPVIELRQNFVHEYNSNLRFYRDELLQANNPFDSLIRTFNEDDRRNLRIDVYDVRLYYLAIGILKEHNINPRHWHYLGEKVTPPISPEKALKDGGHGEADATIKKAGNSNEFNTEQQSSKLQGTEYADAEALNQLQKESLLPPNNEYEHLLLGKGKGNKDNTKGSQKGKENSESNLVNPDTLLESLVELFNSGGKIPSDKKGQSNGDSKRRQQRSMKMHIPNASKSNQKSQSNATMQLSVSPEKYDEIIVAFLLDQLMLARQQRTAFVKNGMKILNRYIQQPSLINNHPHQTLIKNLTKQLKNKQQLDLNYAPLIFQKVNQPNQLLLVANQVGSTNTMLVNTQNSTWNQFINQQPPHRISLLLRSFPGLYGGQTLRIPKDALIMLHPNEQNLTNLQWRPVVITDPWLEDPAMGFIRASIKNNQLQLDPQSHQTQIDKILIAEHVKQPTKQSVFNTQMIYIAFTVTVILLLSIVLLNARNRQKYL